MIINTEIINKNQLERSILNVHDDINILCACALLLSYETLMATKMQFNITTTSGSLHIEYKNKILTYYTRDDFSVSDSAMMSVSFIHAIGSSYTSIVIGEDSFHCFDEFLMQSDQRQSVLIIDNSSVTRIDDLPDSKFEERSMKISTENVEVYRIEEDS